MLQTKKGGSLLLGLAVFLFLFMAMTVSSSATSVTGLSGKVIVHGVDLVSGDDDHSISCGGGTAVYDPAAQTLTLTNAEITQPSNNSRRAGIYVDGFSSTVNVKLVGENSIVLTDTAYDNTGIWNDAPADLQITGSDSLAVTLYNDSSPFGIWNRNASLTVEGAKLSFTLADGSKKNGFLVDTDKAITLNGAELTASGFMQNLFASSGPLTIQNNSKVDITAIESALYSDGNIIVENSTVQADATETAAVCVWGDISFTDSNVTAKSEWDNGIYCYGLVSVSGGKATAVSAENDAFRANGGISVKDSAEVSAVGAGAGIYTNEILLVESGTVNAKGNFWAILARRISGNAQDSKPTDNAAAIVLGEQMAEVSGAEIHTEDWLYTEVWNDWNWEYNNKWMSRSYFVDADAAVLTEATILGGISDGGEAVPTRNDGETIDFWAKLVKKIRDNTNGGVIEANMGIDPKEKMPWRVMEALRTSPGTTLKLLWNGNIITVSSEQAFEPNQTQIYYPLSMLEELLSKAAAEQTPGTAVTEAVNPATGGR